MKKYIVVDDKAWDILFESNKFAEAVEHVESVCKIQPGKEVSVYAREGCYVGASVVTVSKIEIAEAELAPK